MIENHNRHAGRWVSTTLLLVLLVGCAGNEPKDTRGKSSATYTEARERIEVPMQPDAEADAAAAVRGEIPKVEKIAGSGSFINEEVARSQPRQVLAEDGEISFNFEALPVQEVVRAVLGEMLGENYVIAPGVSGEVTFATAKPVNREQIMPILEMLLRWNNAAMVYRDGQYQILPVNQAIPGNLSPRLAKAASVKGFEVLAVPLQYIAPAQMQIILEPYVREGAIVSADNARSLMVLAGTRAELASYLRTIEIFDVDWLDGMSVGIFRLELVEVADVIAELEAVFGEGAETPLAGMFRFLPIERLNAIMVITPQEEYLNQAETWIQRLDRGQAGAANRLYVYRVENLEAGVLADYLLDIFGGSRSQSQSGGERNNLTAGSIGPGLEPVSLSSVNQEAELTSRGQSAARNDNIGEDSRQGAVIGDNENVRITAVEETNSLLIQATPSQYGSILNAIENLDIEPLQVLIEAHVVEVTLNENLEYGVNYFLSNFDPNADGVNIGDGGDGGDDGDTGGSVGGDGTSLNAPGFISRSAGFDGSNTLLTYVSNPLNAFGDFFSATINALESVSDARTISSPTLLVRNNTESSINVGTQVAIANTSFNGIGGVGGTGTIASTQFVQTGTTLTVTPRVNPGGLVYLELNQEVSSPGARPTGGGNPDINTNTLTTNVAVQSGQSIILGGLIRDSMSETESGIPFLRRIPLLGRAFESTTLSSTRSEIVVIIKPTVVETIDNLQGVSDEFSRKFRGLKPLQRPILMPNEAIPREVDINATLRPGTSADDMQQQQP
ncbi:MAG: type II secretion system secretin GspD [Wenzhouxiangellaceae bacterium]